MSEFFQRLGEGLRAGLEGAAKNYNAQVAAGDLMQMSESAGMAHLEVLVPAIVEDGEMDTFMLLLNNAGDDWSESEEYRQKARTFRAHARYLARNLE